MAPNSKRPVGYQFTAPYRRRNAIIQVALTAVVVLFAVSVVLYIVLSGGATSGPQPGEVKAIRVASDKLLTNDGTSEPKAVIAIYEDFLCPFCGEFERTFGDTIARLIDTGAVAVDYYMVAILDSVRTQNYSSRSGNAAYVVAADSTEVFRRFHGTLYAQQPSESSTTYAADDELAALARELGAGEEVADGINAGTYTEMVRGLAKATEITATPTIRINGQDYERSTPDALVAKIEAIVGDVPGLASTPRGAPGAIADDRVGAHSDGVVPATP